MLTPEMTKIITTAKPRGWIMEPEAKRLFQLAGMKIPPFIWISKREDIEKNVSGLNFPLAAKVVSPGVIHKSDVGGVAVNIASEKEALAVFDRFSKIDGFAGVHFEPMAEGIELIIGATVDHQFGPVVMLGIGGTAVEIYQDTVIRMAPLTSDDVPAMIADLKARKLLEGYRGSAPVSIKRLTGILVPFSELAVALEPHVASIDLNPVICSDTDCVIADARMILHQA